MISSKRNKRGSTLPEMTGCFFAHLVNLKIRIICIKVLTIRAIRVII
uniref:Uncharacterized protein n=1 Tax=Siphoviridae sp. ct5FX1 TaxID=2825335 RepID=A0A8S5UPZ4_9CAUD|nr:MAG TPA: hypothetical protein [Siphoviridae sp. ct5FX1]